MRAWGCLAVGLLCVAASGAMAEEGVRPYVIEGDAIAAPLTGRAGDPVKGKALIADRQKSLCILCHSGPFGDAHLQGTISPDLAGVGGRLSEGQIRLRIVDMKSLNPSSIMPSYYRIAEHTRVAAQWRDKPVLKTEEIEDLVSYLVRLKE